MYTLILIVVIGGNSTSVIVKDLSENACRSGGEQVTRQYDGLSSFVKYTCIKQ